MRLIDTATLQLNDSPKEYVQKYAILSHRWGREELSLQEFEARSQSTERKAGYIKIKAFCDLAKSQGLRWAWVDTCSIDKTSSAELSEAINSMYRWYERSNVCIVYLSDIDVVSNGRDISKSKWFTRGWTLQEMLAPRTVHFYDKWWNYIGDKKGLIEQLSKITKVGKEFLLQTTPIGAASTASIMSWAAHRKTTRPEDLAYSLMGLFQINMPLLYGEGDQAFYRLQEEILRTSSDQSLFAWSPPSHSLTRRTVGIFAPHPEYFEKSGAFHPLPAYWNTESTVTNRGIRVKMPLKYDSGSKSFLGILSCMHRTTRQDVAIEFEAKSNTLEDLDHITRLGRPVQLGTWNDDASIRFYDVYLATQNALRHSIYYGTRYQQIGPEMHILLRDPDRVIGSLEPLCTKEARVELPNVMLKGKAETKRVAVLNPALTPTKAAFVVLPTIFEEDLVIAVGFDTLSTGLLDIQKPWTRSFTVPSGTSAGKARSAWEGMPDEEKDRPSNIAIRGLGVQIDVTQQSWWARRSSNVIVHIRYQKDHPLILKMESSMRDATRYPPSSMSGRAQVDEDVLEGVGRSLDVTADKIPSTFSYSVDSGQAWGAQVGDSAVGLRFMKLQLEPSSRAEELSSVLAYLDSNERNHDTQAEGEGSEAQIRNAKR